MDYQDQPLNSSSTPRSPATAAVDNLMRRALRVSDPNDPEQLATALLERYGSVAASIRRESEGLPFVQVATPKVVEIANSAVRTELSQAQGDLERDLAGLLSDTRLKDIEPELRGWAQVVRNAAAEGIASARNALDSNERDRTFAAKRTLNDYARLARYVGALTPNLSSIYRQFAKSLDEIANLLLVMMGDALAEMGMTRGGFLLQAPAASLQERREAALNALRMMTGSTQQAYGSNEWPRGLEAYRQFLNSLEQAGQSDLRALLNEANLGRAFDELIELASKPNSDGLRALAATAQITVRRFRRLVLFGHRLVTPSSPVLASFLSAIKLFTDAIDNTRSGARLLFIARPPLLSYGLYGIGGISTATQLLMDIIRLRNQLADQLDCFLLCGCGVPQVRCQILLDKILYDVDRAIELYALGEDPDAQGEPEFRAMAYGALIIAFAHKQGNAVCLNNKVQLVSDLEDLRVALGWAVADRLPDPGPTRVQVAKFMFSELCIQQDGEHRFENLVETMAPNCLRQSAFEKTGASEVRNLIETAIGLVRLIAIQNDELIELGECPPAEINIPPHFETSLDSLADDIDRVGTGIPTRS